MNLPSLPLIPGKDGRLCLTFDNSFLDIACSRAKQYSFIHKRISTRTNYAADFGSCLHLCLQHRVESFLDKPADGTLTQQQAEIIIKWFSEHPEQTDERYTANHAVEIIQHYNARYQTDPWKLMTVDGVKPLVELPFCVFLFTTKVTINEILTEIDIYYTGRIDLPVIWDDQNIIVDHKTSSMVGREDWIMGQRVSGQPIGYCWAFEKLTGKKAHGFCINGISTKSPPKTKPRNQTIDQWWDEQFIRHKEYVFGYQISEWEINTKARIENFLWQYSRGYFQQDREQCQGKYGRCQFYSVCDVQEESRDLVLGDSMSFKHNDWSPLK